MYLVTKYLRILLVYLKKLCSSFSTSWVQKKTGECQRQRIRTHYMNYPYNYFSPIYTGRKSFVVNSCWAKNPYLLCINKITVECMRCWSEIIDITLNLHSTISKQNIHKQCLLFFFVNCFFVVYCLLQVLEMPCHHTHMQRIRNWRFSGH